MSLLASFTGRRALSGSDKPDDSLRGKKLYTHTLHGGHLDEMLSRNHSSSTTHSSCRDTEQTLSLTHIAPFSNTDWSRDCPPVYLRDIRSLHTNQYSSILYFCSCVAFYCSCVNSLYSTYSLAKGGHAAWVPCEIWGESCKLLASIVRHFQAFILQKFCSSWGLHPQTPHELLIASYN